MPSVRLIRSCVHVGMLKTVNSTLPFLFFLFCPLRYASLRYACWDYGMGNELRSPSLACPKVFPTRRFLNNKTKKKVILGRSSCKTILSFFLRDYYVISFSFLYSSHKYYSSFLYSSHKYYFFVIYVTIYMTIICNIFDDSSKRKVY